MNLVEFLHIHKGLTAPLYDWQQVFGENVVALLAERELPIKTQRKRAEKVLHPRDWTRFTPIDPESSCFCPSDMLADCIYQLGVKGGYEYSLELKDLARYLAPLLGLDKRGISVERPDFVRLQTSPIPAYLSLATSCNAMNMQLAGIPDDKDVIILALLDFSRCHSKLLPRPKVRLYMLEDFVCSHGDPLDLLPLPGRDFQRECRELSPLTHTTERLLDRPKDSGYSDLHFVLLTADKYSTEPHEDDMFLCWYGSDSQNAKQIAAKSKKAFYTSKTFTHTWLLLREAAINGGHFSDLPFKHRKVKTQKSTDAGNERSRISSAKNEAKKTLNMLFDMPPDAKPFMRGKKGQPTSVCFHAECYSSGKDVYDYLSRYNRADIAARRDM